MGVPNLVGASEHGSEAVPHSRQCAVMAFRRSRTTISELNAAVVLCELARLTHFISGPEASRRPREGGHCCKIRKPEGVDRRPTESHFRRQGELCLQGLTILDAGEFDGDAVVEVTDHLTSHCANMNLRATFGPDFALNGGPGER